MRGRLPCEIVEDTRRLLAEYWSEVEAVARALEPNGTLDGAGFMRAVQEGPRVKWKVARALECSKGVEGLCGELQACDRPRCERMTGHRGA
jgi:hypothetical protein